jgi:hypothetical protein
MSRCCWKLTDEDYEFIKGEVTNIFVRYKIKCIPISGFEIASKIGITMIPYSSLSERRLECAMKTSEDGFFLENNGQEYIYYNDIRKYARLNWTILHEIGHIVLDHTGHGEREEAEADFFAKYAIAPPIFIYKIKAKSVKDIYDAFDISLEAAFYAFEYYQKWLHRHMAGNQFTRYEKDLMLLYEENSQIQAVWTDPNHEGSDAICK